MQAVGDERRWEQRGVVDAGRGELVNRHRASQYAGMQSVRRGSGR